MRTALVVDDSRAIRMILSRTLRELGYEVREAGNGSDALAALSADPPADLVMADWNMPVMDGLEFVRRLGGTENGKGVPVVMITTEGSESVVVQALSSGARGYIRKPFAPEDVKKSVVSLLAGKI